MWLLKRSRESFTLSIVIVRVINTPWRQEGIWRIMLVFKLFVTEGREVQVKVHRSSSLVSYISTIMSPLKWQFFSFLSDSSLISRWLNCMSSLLWCIPLFSALLLCFFVSVCVLWLSDCLLWRYFLLDIWLSLYSLVFFPPFLADPFLSNSTSPFLLLQPERLRDKRK